MYGFKVEFKGFEELARKFATFPTTIWRKRMGAAMEKSVLVVEGAVTPLAPVGVSGRLRGSIGSEVREMGSEIIGRVGSSLKSEVYPQVMEFGRDPGSMPPPASLERWVHLKLGVPVAEAPGVAYLVARKIARKGIKGKRFMQKGYEKTQGRVVGFFKSALRLMVKDLGDD